MRGLAVAAAATLALAWGCKAEPAGKPVFELAIDTVTDSGEPLAGVVLTSNTVNLGKSGSEGKVRSRLRGREGLRLPVTVGCPDGYEPEEGGAEIVLKTLKTASGEVAPVTARVVCAPTERIAALVIKTAPELPIKVQGRVIATTNTDGVAHAALRFAPNTTFQVELDTSDKPDLRPRSPVTTLTVMERDEVFPIAFEFKKEQKKKPRGRKRPRPKKEPFRPERVD